MKFRSSFINWGIPILAIISLVTLVAWAGNPQNGSPDNTNHHQDTVPSKKKAKITSQPGDKEFDKELRELDRAAEELHGLSERDWEKVRREIEQSVQKIDLDKIKLDVQKAMKEVDFEGIEKEIESALKKIDFNKIEKDIEKAFRESNFKEELKEGLEDARKEMAKAKLEVSEQLKNKDWQRELKEELKSNSKEFEKEMDNARRELERVKEDLNLEKLNLTKELEGAKIEIEKAKKELNAYQEMVYEMEKDGLIDTKKDYEIEYSEGELLINGKKQSAEVVSKYKKYFKENKQRTTIKKQDGDFNIDLD